MYVVTSRGFTRFTADGRVLRCRARPRGLVADNVPASRIPPARFFAGIVSLLNHLSARDCAVGTRVTRETYGRRNCIHFSGLLLLLRTVFPEFLNNMYVYVRRTEINNSDMSKNVTVHEQSV